MGHFAAQLCHNGACHLVHVHPVGGQGRAADGGIAEIVVAGDGHVLGHAVAPALEQFHHVESHLVAVADKGVRHLDGQGDGDEDPPAVPVLDQPFRAHRQLGPHQGFYVAEVAVHDRAGGQHAAHKGDVPPARLDQVFGDHVAAAGVVAEDAVGGDGVVVKIQQHEGQPALDGGGQVPPVDLAHKDQAVHLAVDQKGGHGAVFFGLGEHDLHQHRQVRRRRAVQHAAVQAVVEGVLIEKAVGDHDADALAAGVLLGAGRHLVAHFPGCGQDAGAQLLADAFLAGQPLGDRDGADPQPLCDIRHPY